MEQDRFFVHEMKVREEYLIFQDLWFRLEDFGFISQFREVV